MPKKKSAAKKPKPRHIWAIHPATKVKESAKKYRRGKNKRKEKNWFEELFDV